jgi:hypothetical protein
MLSLTLHDQEAAVGKLEGELSTFVYVVPELESPCGAKAYRADHRVDTQTFFVITVPAYAVFFVTVLVEKRAVKSFG